MCIEVWEGYKRSSYRYKWKVVEITTTQGLRNWFLQKYKYQHGVWNLANKDHFGDREHETGVAERNWGFHCFPTKELGMRFLGTSRSKRHWLSRYGGVVLMKCRVRGFRHGGVTNNVGDGLNNFPCELYKEVMPLEYFDGEGNDVTDLVLEILSEQEALV